MNKKVSTMAKEWVDPPTVGDSDSLLQRFIYNVLNFGTRYAVDSIEVKLTYSELDHLSERLSCYLKECGVEKGDFIGLCLPNNANWVVALLAILKSGAVYFPIDPTYPIETVKYMISNTDPKMILSSRRFDEVFSRLRSDYVDIENQLSIYKQQPYSVRARLSDLYEISPSDLAYVIYTSGTTGNPKGILVTHGNLCNIYCSRKDYYPENFRGLISGGVCFDASLLATFYSLMSGGCLCLFNFRSAESISELKDFINEFQVNYIISVPSKYRDFLNNKPNVCLQCVSLTGEQLPKSLSLLHAEYAPQTQLLNEYGPSEYAIGTSIATIYSPEGKTLREISVGYPLSNTWVYILDDKLRPTPEGSLGEIYISGVGVSAGYLKEEKLNTQRFMNISINGGKVKRTYRTGDIGRYVEGEEIQCLGRIENQVQYKGQKIYLATIENIFYQHPNIYSVVVFSHFGSNDEEIVVCFTTVQSTSFDELYDFLDKNLSLCLPPLRLIRYNQFPMLPNGKIDRVKILNAIHSKDLWKKLKSNQIVR